MQDKIPIHYDGKKWIKNYQILEKWGNWNYHTLFMKM